MAGCVSDQMSFQPVHNTYQKIKELLLVLGNHISTKEQYLGIFIKEMNIFSSVPGCSSLVDYCNTKIRSDCMDLSMMRNLLGKIDKLIDDFKPVGKPCVLKSRDILPTEVKTLTPISLQLRQCNASTSNDTLKRKIDMDHDYVETKKLKPCVLNKSKTFLTKNNHICSKEKRLRTMNTHLKKKLRITQIMVKQLNKRLRAQRTAKFEKQTVRNYLLNKNLSSTEISHILKPNSSKRKIYTRTDFVRGLVLYSQSRKCYKYIREQKLCPLPCPTSLSTWVGKIKCTTGIQHQILAFLKEKSLYFDKESDLNVSLTFDEIDIKSQFSYDSRNKKFLFPAKHVQVAMVRGISCPYKQPIFWDFDTPMTKELLFHS